MPPKNPARVCALDEQHERPRLAGALETSLSQTYGEHSGMPLSVTERLGAAEAFTGLEHSRLKSVSLGNAQVDPDARFP